MTDKQNEEKHNFTVEREGDRLIYSINSKSFAWQSLERASKELKDYKEFMDEIDAKFWWDN